MAEPRGSKYPVQKVLMLSTDVATLIEDVAAREGLRQTEVIRAFLHAGIRKAGYGDILTTDGPLGHVGPDTAQSDTPAP